MYSKIHQLKSEHLNKSQVARRLNLNIKTVIKYWDVSPEEFTQKQQDSHRRSCKLERFKEVILERLIRFPDYSAAQLEDWLKEVYPNIQTRARTVRRYIARLRKDYQLPKIVNQRQYEAVTELPPGQQLQVDFGQVIVPTALGGHKNLYCMATVLAHSRFKYAEWSDQPLTTAHLIMMLRRSFFYMGGMPKELVFDQDKLVIVSENHGDIIYTEEFEAFKQALHFKVYLCRKADPESKGKIEAVVKYVKNNFAKHRMFTKLDDWNQEQLNWLERTGNQKVHGTTKKIPAEVLLLEKPHLKPIPFIKIPKDIVTATVRKDNTVLYRSNRYSVPLGTYRLGRRVRINIQGNKLQILENESDKLLAEHCLSIGRGQLIKNSNHCRDHRLAIDTLQNETLALLPKMPGSKQFVTTIRQLKSRYARDQFQLLNELAHNYPETIIKQAISECLRLGLFSAGSCREIGHYLLAREKEVTVKPVTAKLPASMITPCIQTEHRQLTNYTDLYRGADQ